MKYGTLCYLDVDEKVLMIRKHTREKDPNSGFCTLPGGKLNNSEKGGNEKGRLEGVVREFYEETGLTLQNPVFRGIILFDNNGRIFPNWPNPEDFLVYIFSAGQCKGKLRGEMEEGVPVWVDKKELMNLPQNPGDVKMYEWIKSGRKFAGVIKHTGNLIDNEGTFVDYF